MEREMTANIDYEEEIRQRFAMLHLAWDRAYGRRKHDPNLELREYLHILAGINAIWNGIGESKHYRYLSPNYQLDSGLSIGICRCICDILINTHPKHSIPESLAAELMEVTIDLLERYVCADVNQDQIVIKSFENVIHVLCLKSGQAYEVADKSVNYYSKMIDDYDGSVFQDLINIIGPSVAYSEYVLNESEEFEGVPQYWANDLYRGIEIDNFEHMSCDLCWGSNSPETLAVKEIREEEARKAKAGKE
jgi:hypothetical protein